MRKSERMGRAREAVGFGFGVTHEEAVSMMAGARGSFIFDMQDAQSGDSLCYWEKKNVITRDAGILAARLFKNSETPIANRNNGLRMLAVGTGATGAVLAPDAPQATQRKLNSELVRKAFASTTYRDSLGNAVAYPTNIVDFTTTFTTSEAVGSLNEMALISPYSVNPAVTNPINNGPGSYDDTIDVSAKDLLCNYLTFAVVSKPNTAVLTISYRLTF